jgi:hypothetical protein
MSHLSFQMTFSWSYLSFFDLHLISIMEVSFGVSFALQTPIFAF